MIPFLVCRLCPLHHTINPFWSNFLNRQTFDAYGNPVGGYGGNQFGQPPQMNAYGGGYGGGRGGPGGRGGGGRFPQQGGRGGMDAYGGG